LEKTEQSAQNAIVEDQSAILPFRGVVDQAGEAKGLDLLADSFTS